MCVITYTSYSHPSSCVTSEYAEASVSIFYHLSYAIPYLNNLVLKQFPTSIARHLFKLGQIHGHAKISYTLLSMGLPEPVLRMMEAYLNYGQVFQVEGYDF